MAVNMGTAIAYLELDTSKFSKGFTSAFNDLKVFGDKSATAEQKMNGLSSAFKTTGGMLSKSVTLPLVGVGVAAVKTASDFEAGMSEVKAISGATGSEFDALRDKAIEMGAKTKFSASDSADAFKYMAMAGWDASQMMDGIAGIMDLAAASGEDLATTSDIVTDALTAFGLQASDSAHFADVLAQASSKSNTNVGLMGETFKYVAPVAGALGYSIEDTAVAIGLMANSGIKGSQAGTALRSTITRLAKPVGEAKDAVEELGISITNADGTMKPLSQTMVELREKFAGLTEEQKAQYAAMLAGQEGMSGLLAIVNASDEDFQKLTDEINNANGAAEDMASVMMDNTAGAVEQLKGALESAGILIGEKLTPYIRDLAEWITGLVEKFNNLSDEQQDNIVKWGLILAAIGPVLLILSKVISIVSVAMKAFGLLRTAIVGLTTAFRLLRVGNLAVMTAMGGIPKAVAGIVTAISGITAPIMAVVAVVGVLIGAFVTLWKTNEDFRNKMTQIWNKIRISIDGFFDGVVERINALGFDFESITEVIKAVWLALCDILAPVFEGAFNTIAIVLDGVFKLVLSVMDIFIGLFTGNMEQFGDGIKGIISGIVETFADLGSNILGAIGDIGAEILEKLGFEKAAEGFQDFFDTLSELFGQIPELLSSAIDTIVSFFTETIPNAFNSAIEAVQGFVDNIIEFFTVTVPEAFNTFVNETIPNAINSIVSWFEQLPYMIGYAIGELIGHFYLFATDLWTWITTELPLIIEGIIQWFAQLPSRIWEWLTGVVTNVINWGVEMYNNAVSAASNFVNGAIEWISQLPSRIWAWLTTTVSNVISWGANMVSQARSTATNFVNSFISFITSLPSKVWEIIQQIPSKVSEIGSQLYNAGRNIFQSLWNGIKSIGDSILGWVSDFAGKIGSFVSGIVDGFKHVVSGANDAKSAARSVDGKHANGLDYVPYNGYVAELHEGERVLTKQQNREYNEGGTGKGGDTFNFYNTKPTPYEYARQMKKAKRDLELGY
ncbi:minor tail protein [Clostridium phage CS266P3]|nr:minor tail protein [Clostridium phage CS266P3]